VATLNVVWGGSAEADAAALTVAATLGDGSGKALADGVAEVEQAPARRAMPRTSKRMRIIIGIYATRLPST
jgi:hypothetical protein